MDKSELPGIVKSLIYQHGILPQIRWPLLVYNVPRQWRGRSGDAFTGGSAYHADEAAQLCMAIMTSCSFHLTSWKHGSIGSFRSRLDIVCSNSTCEVWGGWLSDVWAIGFSDWRCASESPWCVGGRDTVCALVFYTLRSVISCFHVLENWHETSCYYVSSGQSLLCLFGNASLHV